MMELNKQRNPTHYQISNSKIRPTWSDVYLGRFKWYRKLRKCIWYQHKFTMDALELSINFQGTFWAVYGKINRYSDIMKIEIY